MNVEQFRKEQERELDLYCAGLRKASYEIMKEAKEAFEKGKDEEAVQYRKTSRLIEDLISQTDSYRRIWIEAQIKKMQFQKLSKSKKK